MHVDTVHPLPTSAEGFTHLFTMVDRSIRWLEVVPIKCISAQKCVDKFIATWVARYGCLAIITSDQGSQFTSAQGKDCIGCKGSSSTPLQSNDKVERCNGQLKCGQHTVAWTSPLGLTWPEDGIKEEQCYLLRRANAWNSTFPSSRVHLGCIAISRAVPEAAVGDGHASQSPATDVCTGGCQASNSLNGAQPCIHRCVPLLAPLYTGTYKVLETFKLDWLPP